MILEQDCLKLDTGVRAIWLLYRWGRWDLLGQLGLSRDYETDLETFDDHNIISDRGRINREKQVIQLIKFNPPVLQAAINLIGEYLVLTASDNKGLD